MHMKNCELSSASEKAAGEFEAFLLTMWWNLHRVDFLVKGVVWSIRVTDLIIAVVVLRKIGEFKPLS